MEIEKFKTSNCRKENNIKVDFKNNQLWGWLRIRKKYGEFFTTWTTFRIRLWKGKLSFEHQTFSLKQGTVISYWEVWYSVVCCQVEFSATSWSLDQRSPNDCGASFRAIKNPRKWGSLGPLEDCCAKSKQTKLCFYSVKQIPSYKILWYALCCPEKE